MVQMTAADDDLVAWLLEGDPSIRGGASETYGSGARHAGGNVVTEAAAPSCFRTSPIGTGPVAIPSGSTRSSLQLPPNPVALRRVSADSSTSLTERRYRTNASAPPSTSCGVRVEPTVAGRHMRDTPGVPGSRWRNPVRAGGTPCECCAC